METVWEQKLTLRKDSYWGSFCSILVITVDSKECEVVMQSLLNLVLMCPHVRANSVSVHEEEGAGGMAVE